MNRNLIPNAWIRRTQAGTSAHGSRIGFLDSHSSSKLSPCIPTQLIDE